MNYKTLVKKLSIEEKDFAEIAAAVAAAEQRTTGEIALAVTAESASYAFWELFAAVCTTFALLLCLFPLAAQVYRWLGTVFWGVEPWYLMAFYLTVVAVVVLALYVLYNVPALDRLVIPVRARHKAVTDRALRYFVEGGVYATTAHSGILVFVSYFEREVRIIADSGISRKISPDLWNLIADEMTESLAKGNAKDAFVNAVERCGALLAENFPLEAGAAAEKPNELNDGLVVLGDEKWV